MRFAVARDEWERRYDEAAELVSRRRLSDGLDALHKLQTWQRRVNNFGVNHSWHDAEILWLEGVALERARRRRSAQLVWQKLAALTCRWALHEPRARAIFYDFPQCERCAERALPFAPSWRTVVRELTPLLTQESLMAEYFAGRVRGHSS